VTSGSFDMNCLKHRNNLWGIWSRYGKYYRRGLKFSSGGKYYNCISKFNLAEIRW